MTTRFEFMTGGDFESEVEIALATETPFESAQTLVREAVQCEAGKALAYGLAYSRHLDGARKGISDDVRKLQGFFAMAEDKERAIKFASKVEIVDAPLPDRKVLEALGLSEYELSGETEVHTFYYTG